MYVPMADATPDSTEQQQIQKESCGTNRNVLACWIETAFVGLGSVWTGSIFSTYLFMLLDNNTYVGYITAAQGTATLLFALPIGYIADHYSRALILRIGGVVCFGAIATTSHAVLTDQNGDSTLQMFYIMLLSQMLWGVFNGIYGGPAQAIYADSITSGNRSRYYTIENVISRLTSAIGPGISAYFLFLGGNAWSLDLLRWVILAGMVLEFFAGCCSFFYRDEYTIKESAAVTETSADSLNEDDADSEQVRLKQQWVPYIIFASNLVIALGSGMTIQFFPLFFKNDCGLSPVAVQVVCDVLVPISVASLSSLGLQLSKVFGRVMTLITLQAFGVSVLVMMVVLKSQWGNPYVMVPLYLVRSGVMNCTYPLKQSIMMDFCPKKQRARWASLNSIAGFGWSGSAALGGVLADKYGYGISFLGTAILQGAGICICILLFPLVPRETHKSASGSVVHNATDRQAPLLPGGNDFKQSPTPARPPLGMSSSSTRSVFRRSPMLPRKEDSEQALVVHL